MLDTPVLGGGQYFDINSTCGIGFTVSGRRIESGKTNRDKNLDELCSTDQVDLHKRTEYTVWR